MLVVDVEIKDVFGIVILKKYVRSIKPHSPRVGFKYIATIGIRIYFNNQRINLIFNAVSRCPTSG